MKLPTPDMDLTTRRILMEIVDRLDMKEEVKSYLFELLLYEEEAQHMIKFFKSNPEATEEQAMAEADAITQEVTKKLGMTAIQRDMMYPIG